MIKLSSLKSGDIILVHEEDVKREGIVARVSHEQRQALVDNGVQEFWYSPEDMTPIPLDEAQLFKLGFTREVTDAGIKYKKDSFRMLVPRDGDFSELEMWWREDRRHFSFRLNVHEFQNLFLDMTKVHLERAHEIV